MQFQELRKKIISKKLLNYVHSRVPKDDVSVLPQPTFFLSLPLSKTIQNYNSNYVVIVTWARVICLKYTHLHSDCALVLVRIFPANHLCP